MGVGHGRERHLDALAERAPMRAKVFLGPGGGDGIDTAAKLGRRYWWEVGEPNRTLLISRTAGYGGHASSASSPLPRGTLLRPDVDHTH